MSSDKTEGASDESTAGPSRSKRLAAKRKNVEEPVQAPVAKKSIRSNAIPWNGLEKANFLKGMAAHGSKDPEKLAEYCQYRTPETIQSFINKQKEEMTKILREIPTSSGGNYRKEDRPMDAPIEKWIKIVQNANRSHRSDCGHVLPKVLEWIANHEDHPDPEECGGIDYKAIYLHLAHLMTGDVPPDANHATSQRIIDLFVTLRQKVRDVKSALAPEMAHLSSKFHDDSISNTVSKGGKPKMTLDVQHADTEDHQLPGVDPLDLKPKFYDKKIIQK